MHLHRHGPTWRYEFVYGGRRYRRAGFPTKALAGKAADVEQDRVRRLRIFRTWGVRDSVERARQIPTLARYVREVYTPHHLPRLAPSTQKTARSQLARLVADLGRRPLDDLTPAALDAFAAQRLKAVGPAMVAEDINRLSRVVNHARSRGVIDEHPFRGWKRPRVDRRDYRVVTPEEEAKLLAAAAGLRVPFDLWIRLALYAGLRKGEIRALEPSMLQGGELRIRQPKTGRVKVVPVDEETTRQLRVNLPSTSSRSRVSLSWIDRQWQRTLKAAGLSGIRFHDLRHTFASRLADAGVALPTVGELMGHSPPYTMTLRYFHTLPDAKREAISRLVAPKSPPMRSGGRQRQAAEMRS